MAVFEKHSGFLDFLALNGLPQTSFYFPRPHRSPRGFNEKRNEKFSLLGLFLQRTPLTLLMLPKGLERLGLGNLKSGFSSSYVRKGGLNFCC